MLEMRSKLEWSQAAIALGKVYTGKGTYLLSLGTLLALPIVSKFSRRGAEVG